MNKISVTIFRQEKLGSTYEDYIYGKIGDKEFRAKFWYPSQRATKGSWWTGSGHFTNTEKRAIGKACKEYCRQHDIGKGFFF